MARIPPWQGDPPPGPYPGGKLRGIRSRPTPKGEIEGDQIKAHTQGEIQGDQEQTPPEQLLLRVVHILLECILVHAIFGKNLSKQECIPVGCILPDCCPYLPACTAPGGVPASGPGGCLLPGDVPASGLGGGGCIPACNGADPPL